MERSHGIRVLVADDHDLIRELLEFAVEGDPDLELVGSAADTEQVVRLCEERRPEVVVLDWRMPVVGGASVTRAIAEICPSAKVVAYTGASTPEEHREIVDAGAFSFIVKGGGSREVVRAIHEAARA